MQRVSPTLTSVCRCSCTNVFFSSVPIRFLLIYRSEYRLFFFICLDTLCAVLQRDTLSIRENRLFGAVVRWAEAECYRQQLPPTSENKQKVLGKALPLIRFPLMTVEEFAAGMWFARSFFRCTVLTCPASFFFSASCWCTTQTTETSLIFFLVQQGLPSLEYCTIGRW